MIPVRGLARGLALYDPHALGTRRASGREVGPDRRRWRPSHDLGGRGADTGTTNGKSRAESARFLTKEILEVTRVKALTATLLVASAALAFGTGGIAPPSAP